MKKIILNILFILFVFSVVSSLSIASASDYPNRPVTWIVPFGVGGANGVTARVLAEYMKTEIGQPINIVHKTGASGVVGLRAFENEKPDGYTLFVTSSAALNAAYFLGTERPDMDKFKYVGSYMPQQRVVFTHPYTPYKNWEEFLEYTKEHPGFVSIGAGGGEWSIATIKAIAVKEGLDLRYVTFASGGDAAAAVLGSHVDATDSGVGSATYQAAVAGDLNVLLVLGDEKLEEFPEVPTVKELDYPFTCTREYGIMLRAEVSEEIREFWEEALRETLENPQFLSTMRELGFVPRFLPGEEYEKLARYAANSVGDLFEYIKVLEE